MTTKRRLIPPQVDQIELNDFLVEMSNVVNTLVALGGNVPDLNSAKTVSTSAPTVNDDVDLGYRVGSVWIHVNGATKDAYICIENADGAATWKKTTP